MGIASTLGPHPVDSCPLQTVPSRNEDAVCKSPKHPASGRECGNPTTPLLLRPSGRFFIREKLIKMFDYYPWGKAPDALGMMVQGIDDDESTVAHIGTIGLISYRVHRNHVKLMSLGSLQKGVGTVLMDWLEERFRHKAEIRLWASPNAREFYEKRGYVRVTDMGDYALTLSKTPVRLRAVSRKRERKSDKVLDTFVI